MASAFSSPCAGFCDLHKCFDALLTKTIRFNGEDVKTALRSFSFNGRDLRSHASRKKLLFEGSLSFKGTEMNASFSLESPTSEKENFISRSVSFKSGDKGDQLIRDDSSSEIKNSIPFAKPGDQRHHAAVKLQKVYKSFRTRRQLADCAVVVEQRWWKLLDFAELKRSSISFFDIEKPETAISRWSRARKRAAKLGKGCSKDEKARKLALQHWLEAIDPRHRYGHNLQFYYVKWLHCQSRQPFFYWLDIGEGKEVNLDRCLRSKLQQQCIKYLGSNERQAYQVVLENGKFVYKQSGKILDTTEGPKDAKWIFVLSTSKTLYVGMKKKGNFQHSSFLAGGATLSAGRLVVELGVLKAVWPHSGHYLPTEENFQEFMSFLKEHNVDLFDVKKSPTEEEEEGIFKRGNSNSIRESQSNAYLRQFIEATNIKRLPWKSKDFSEQDSEAAENNDQLTATLSGRLNMKITKLEIPTRSDDALGSFKEEAFKPSSNADLPQSPCKDGYESAEDSILTEEDFMFPKMNLFDEDEEEEDKEPVPKEKILKRINSHKEMKSYQLAKQLSSRWTTGAGPRIGCMRDYPLELQVRVLEQANLSPREGSGNSTPWMMYRFSHKNLTPISASRKISSSPTTLAPATP